MSDPGPPEYNVYRSGRGLRDRLRPSGDEPGGLRELRKLREGRGGNDSPGQRKGARRGFPWRRVVKIVLAVCVAWILLSVILFFVSAQTDEGEPKRVQSALDGGGSLFTGSTILVLGSDARPKGSKEPGAGGSSRSDSIMLMHVGFGTVRKLSIPRDSLLPGGQKINSAYNGGPAAAIKTVRSFMGHGLKVNHVIEVNFTEFPELIDSLGGIDVTLKRCISSPPFGGRRFKLRAGENHLDGRLALAFARVRKNKCSPAEDDRDRAKRQQLVLSEIRSKALSPATFLRLPWVAWQAPRTIRTDMRGLGLSGLFTDLLTGGTGATHVLKGTNQEGGIFVSEDDKAAGVRLLEGR